MQCEKYISIFIWILISTAFSQAQDLHYSNYNYNKLYLNPSNTGGFHGTLRAGASYRDQYRTFLGEAYQSTMIWVDAPVAIGKKENQWLGVGFYLLTDKTGDLGLSQNGTSLSLSYHLSLDDDYDKVFAIGIQGGMLQKKFKSAENAVFGDDNQSVRSDDHALLENFEEANTDMNIGLNYKQRISKTNSFEIGTALFHIKNPFSKNDNPRVGDMNLAGQTRFNLYGQYNTALNKTLDISYAMYFSRLGKANNIILQSITGYKFNKEKNHKIKAGLGYRVGDALIFSLGMKYKNWDVGINYDMTISSATRLTNTVGGIELGIVKQINIYRKPEVKPSLICPRH